MDISARKVVILNGQPGTGKTTLKTRLATDLGIPALGKDDIKEFLYDTLGTHDADWPGVLGRASSTMLLAAAQAFAEANIAVLIESAFIYSFAHADWQQFIRATHADTLELYCRTEPEVRRRRFESRTDRHAGHLDRTNEFSDDELAQRYASLRLGKTIDVDTTDFGDNQYSSLLADVRAYLKGE